MKHKIKNASAALIAILVLLIVELISMSQSVPAEQQRNFENISNTIMFAVAVAGFFLSNVFTLAYTWEKLTAIYSDIMVSVISFLMNIYVFGYELGPKQSGYGIWGWHICWIISITVQILLLSGLGKALLGWIKRFLSVLRTIGRELGGFVSDLWNTIRKSNLRMLLIIALGLIVWGIYGGTLCYKRGVPTVLSEIDFWGKSALLGISYSIFVFLLCALAWVSQKVKAKILGINGKRIAAGTLWNARIRKVLTHKNAGSVKRKDVVVILSCFILIPLSIIFCGTWLWADGSSMIGQDPTSITSWLEFLGAAIDVARELITFLI